MLIHVQQQNIGLMLGLLAGMHITFVSTDLSSPTTCITLLTFGIRSNKSDSSEKEDVHVCVYFFLGSC
jgi:hypothetical protein